MPSSVQVVVIAVPVLLTVSAILDGRGRGLVVAAILFVAAFSLFALIFIPRFVFPPDVPNSQVSYWVAYKHGLFRAQRMILAGYVPVAIALYGCLAALALARRKNKPPSASSGGPPGGPHQTSSEGELARR